MESIIDGIETSDLGLVLVLATLSVFMRRGFGIRVWDGGWMDGGRRGRSGRGRAREGRDLCYTGWVEERRGGGREVCAMENECAVLCFGNLRGENIRDRVVGVEL